MIRRGIVFARGEQLAALQTSDMIYRQQGILLIFHREDKSTVDLQRLNITLQTHSGSPRPGQGLIPRSDLIYFFAGSVIPGNLLITAESSSRPWPAADACRYIWCAVAESGNGKTFFLA